MMDQYFQLGKREGVEIFPIKGKKRKLREKPLAHAQKKERKGQ